ncbi:hypothetical protein DFH06DRAFT_575937 [Mycena polygramma]|nr:hypothetical protein DFH06DRAFT_575937 [Mycena polygramma]
MDSRYSAGDRLFSSSLLPTPMEKEQLLSLLRSNSVPAEHSHFDTVIASSRPEVVRYDTEIQRLQRLLDRMLSERAELLHYIDGCRSLFCPIRRLPTEIITEIFALCSPDPVHLYDPKEEVPDDMFERGSQLHLLRLSQVSVRWHDIIAQTSWTITLDCSGMDRQVNHRRILLSRSLERSGHCPLVVSCIVNKMESGAPEQMLARHCARWRTADIYLSTEAAESFSNTKGNLPILERLEIGGSGPLPNDIFSVAPKLTHVTLAINRGIVPKLPWAQLRRIDYHFHDGTDAEDQIQSILAIMGSCSSQCVFNVHRLDLSYLAYSAPLTSIVSNIQALSLSLYDTEAQLGKILRALSLPCLQKLVFRGWDHRIIWPRDHFPVFVSRSSSPSVLSTLFLHDVVISEDELVACLSDMNALSQLFIQDIVDGRDTESILLTDSLLRRLTWTADSSCLAPHLSSMRFASLFTFRSQTLLDFITSRLPSGRRGNVPFEMDLTWQTAEEPHIDGSVLAHIVQLRDDRQLRWSLERCEID